MHLIDKNPLRLRGGANFAPVKPLLAIKNSQKEGTSHYFADALKERYQHFMSLDPETWSDLISVGHLTSLFIQGKQNLKFNNLTKSFYAVPVQHSKKEKERVTPLMRFYTSNMEARYISSNPNVEVIAGRDDDKCQQAAKAAKVIVDKGEEEYTNWFNRNEALLLMSFGTQVNQYKWNPGKKGFKAFKKIFETRNVPVHQGVGQCFDCGTPATGAEFLSNGAYAQCPNCGSTNAYAEPPKSESMRIQTGKKQIDLGNFDIRQLEFPACRWNLRVRAEESSYFIYEQMVSLGVIHNLFGEVDIPQESGGSNNFGLDVVKNLSLAGLSINGRTGTDDARSSLYKNEVKLSEMYLSPEDLAGIKVHDDEQTLCGEKLPKDAYYSDLFQDGLVALGLNGFQTVIGIYAETHKNQLSTGIWHLRQYSGAGQGVSDTVELQRRYNENDSQGYLATKLNATPATAYAEGAIDPEYVKYLGKPDVAFPINIDNFPNIRSINDIIGSPRLGQVDAALLQYQSQNIHNMMQLSMQVTHMAGGLPGVDNQTATGAKIGDAYASSMSTPMLSTKADVRLGAAPIIVRLYTENVPVKQFFPLKSRSGASQGVWLSGADLDTDLAYQITKDSELARNAYTVRDDNDRFFMTVGGAAGYIQLKTEDPEFAEELTRRYGVNYESNNFDEVAAICRERFEEAKKLLKQFKAVQAQFESHLPQSVTVGGHSPDAPAEDIPLQMQADGSFALPAEDSTPDNPNGPAAPTPAPQQNAMLAPQGKVQLPEEVSAMIAMQTIEALQRPITPFELNHVQKATWFQKFLDTDEFLNLSPEERPLVYQFIQKHYVSGAQQAALTGSLAGAAGVAGSAPQDEADTAKQERLNQSKSTAQSKK